MLRFQDASLARMGELIELLRSELDRLDEQIYCRHEEMERELCHGRARVNTRHFLYY